MFAVLEKLFPMGTTLRFLETTEPDHVGGRFNRVRIDYAKDSINLRIPRALSKSTGTAKPAAKSNLRSG
jgi:hypothetical protein